VVGTSLALARGARRARGANAAAMLGLRYRQWRQWRRRDWLVNVAWPALLAVLLLRGAARDGAAGWLLATSWAPGGLLGGGGGGGAAAAAAAAAARRAARRHADGGSNDDPRDIAMREFLRATPPPGDAHLVPGSAARAEWAAARQRELRRWWGAPEALPSATPVPGPRAFRRHTNERARRIVGRDDHDVELIAFRKVLQHIIHPMGVTEHVMGFFKGWMRDERTGAYIGHLYADGEKCLGFPPRSTKVFFVCWPNATKAFHLVNEVETSPCQYELTAAHADFCEIEGRPPAEVD
jgi:hypothetical protein